MKIRILDDLTGKERTVDTDRAPAEVLRDALVTVRASRRAIYRLCIHIGKDFPDLLTLHWYCSNDEIARDITFFVNSVSLMTEGILSGRVPA